MKRFAAALAALLLAPALVFAQAGIGTNTVGPTYSFTITTSAATGAALIDNAATTIIQLTGTFAGVVIQFQFSAIGESVTTIPSTAWTTKKCYPTGTSTGVTGGTANDIWACNSIGLKWVRLQPNSAGATTNVIAYITGAMWVLPVTTP